MFNLFEKSLYQQILGHIHDPSTWIAFALTCKLFAGMCREDTPARKLEFRVSISEWMGGYTRQYIHIYAPSRFMEPLVLPNGALHGNVKTGVDGVDMDEVGDVRSVDTGNVLSFKGLTTGLCCAIYFPDYCKMFFVRNVLIVTQMFNNINRITFYNLKQNTFICGYGCPVCNKIHSFYIAGTNLTYNKTCLETKYELVCDYDLVKKWRRNKMARQILQYVKLQRQ